MLHKVNNPDQPRRPRTRARPRPFYPSPLRYPVHLRTAFNRAISEDSFIPCQTREKANLILLALDRYILSCTEWRYTEAPGLQHIHRSIHPTAELVSLDPEIILDADHFPLTIVLSPDPAFDTKLYAHAVGRGEYKQPPVETPITEKVYHVLRQRNQRS
jgi:hypothetical protein